MSHTNLVRLCSTLACTAGLLVAVGSAYGTAVLTTNPTGFTNKVNLFPFHSSPFTDANGNTASLGGRSVFQFAGDDPAIFTVTFKHPVVKAGFDLEDVLGSNQGPFQLSNGDSTATSSCPSQPPFTCFLGVTDNVPFTSFSILLTPGPPGLSSFNAITDFRYTPASVVTPEPASWALMAPGLIAGFAALRLKRRAK